MFLDTIKRNYKPGKPIPISEIFLLFPNFTRAYVFRLLNKAIEQKEMERVYRGIYCVLELTPLGYYTPSGHTIAVSKYVNKNGEICGILSGLSLLNSFSVITQVPNDLEIVTNKEKTRRREVQISGMNFILRKSRFEITKENYKYYIVLQLILEINKGFKFTKLSKMLVKEFIEENKLKNEKMLLYASAFPRSVSRTLLNSGVIYESAQL